VSTDPVDRQKQFDEENDLGFPLLSDPDKTVAALFGVKRFGPMPSKRATFVIGKDKKLVAAITSETNMNKHADDALDALAQL
jgi:peroxiredoxin Q/BCP